jgi:hypothetical protein
VEVAGSTLISVTARVAAVLILNQVELVPESAVVVTATIASSEPV